MTKKFKSLSEITQSMEAKHPELVQTNKLWQATDSKISELLTSLKRFRKSLKIKQQDAADVLGVSQPTVSRYEKGDEEISLKDFVALAELYGCEFSLNTKTDHEEYRLEKSGSSEPLYSQVDVKIKGWRKFKAERFVKSRQAKLKGGDLLEINIPSDQVAAFNAAGSKGRFKTVKVNVARSVEAGKFIPEKVNYPPGSIEAAYIQGFLDARSEE